MHSDRAGRVVVVGTLNVDAIWRVPSLPRPGETVLAESVEQQFGGKGANQAVAAARTGATVTLVGAVGDDAAGRSYREHLVLEGIATDHVAIVAGGRTGAAHVYVDSRGENLIAVDRGANGRVALAALPALLAKADALLVQFECGLAVATAALELAARQRVRGVLNAAPADPAFPWGAQRIDTVIVNEHECRGMLGAEPSEIARLSAAARRDLLHGRGMDHLVVTRGAAPTLHVALEAVEEVPTLRVDPRDTVGAGDTFAGALVAELAAGREWPAALRYANAAAALSTLGVGAQTAMPRRSDVEHALLRGA